jgi:hypothetical protein
MCIPHQGVFHHRSLFADAGFDADLRIAGDYEFLFRAVRDTAPAFFASIVAGHRTGGISRQFAHLGRIFDEMLTFMKNAHFRLVGIAGSLRSPVDGRHLQVDGLFGNTRPTQSGPGRCASRLRRVL